MKYVNGIVNIEKKSDSNVSAELTIDPSAPVILPIVCENPKDTKSNDSKKTVYYSYITGILQLIIIMLKHPPRDRKH